MNGRRVREVIGSRIACRDGTSLGEVHDVVIDQDEAVIVAFLLGAPTGQAARVVPFEAVYDIRDGVVTVVTTDDVVLASRLPRIGAHLARHVPLLGAPIRLPAPGPTVVVRDAVFNPETGRLLGVIVAHDETSSSRGVTLCDAVLRWEPLGVRLRDDTANVLRDLLGDGRRADVGHGP